MTTNDPHSSDFLLQRYMKNSGFAGSSTSSKSPKVNVAVFGMGRAGMIHMDNILNLPRFKVRYILDNNQERLSAIQANYALDDSTTLVTDKQLDLVLGDQSLDAVIIATPSHDHEKYAVAALKAKKHVLCEKPIALDMKAIQNCYSIAKQNDRHLLCAFNRRYDPSYSDLKKQVQSGVVGKIHHVKTVSRDSPKPSLAYLKISGGIYHDCIVHDVDLISNFVMSERPDRVFVAAHAFDSEIEKIGDHDTVSVTMKFPSGTLGHIDISREAVYGYDQRLEVLGSKGMLRVENQRPSSLMQSMKEGCSVHPISHSFPSRYKEAYTRQLEHFLSLIEGKEEIKVSERDVIDCLHVISAMEESVKTGQFVKVKY